MKFKKNQLSIAIFGLGNMGSSLARGLFQKTKTSPVEIEILGCDIHQDKLFFLKNDIQLKEFNLQSTGKNFPSADCIILCVKPQDFSIVAETLKPNLKRGQLIISILAGITLSDLSEATKFSGAIVRAMPNIPAKVGLAATAACHNGKLTPEQTSLCELIFQSVGEIYWTKESLLDAVTGLSGSGPAYIYMVIEALTDGGVKMGLPRDLALNLATQTVLGSAKLVKESRLHPAMLRDQVTTPGGTTIHAIHELESRGLRAMLISAVETATEKSQNLRRHIKK